MHDALTCTIRGEPTCEAGQSPQIQVALTNRSGRAIYLVGSLDASDCRWRYPHCYFEVTAPVGQPPGGIGRCGNTNGLRANDFVKVPPGGTFNPYQRVDDHGFFSAHQLSERHFTTPGEYRIRFVYSTLSDDIKAWDGRGGESAASEPQILRMFRLVPKVEVRSEEFLLTVVAPGK